jgi:hypothetical protein
MTAVHTTPDNPLLYAKLVWDQPTEQGRFRRIEDEF